MFVWEHHVEDLCKYKHDLSKCTVACLKLPICQVDALQKGAYLKKELERVLFILHITVVSHFLDQLLLNPLKFIAENVVQNDLVELGD